MKIKKIRNIKTSETILSVFQNIHKVMKIKRIFFVNAKKKCIRGKHAHKNCTQVLMSVKGNFSLEIINNKVKKNIRLKEMKNYVIVPPKHWINVHFEKNQKLMVMCDFNFLRTDYINNFKIFKNIN